MSVRSNPSLAILVVEDDAATADFIKGTLAAEGHRVEVHGDGKDGLKYAVAGNYDLIVLDRMIPGVNGLSIVKSMRGAGVRTPVLFLTALGGVDDRVEGLEAGGDDYVVKPFAQAELIARVNALSRRSNNRQEQTVLRAGDLELDLIERRARRGNKEIALQPREFKLLEVLLRNQGRVVTRAMLLESVWDFHFDPKTSIVETHISRVRDKVDRPFATQLIQTIRGVGYCLDDGT